MKNMTRAELKKQRKKFRVDDMVTWGTGVNSHKVLEVQERGLIVDAISAGFGKLFVAFDGNVRHGVHHNDGERAEGTLRVVQAE